MVVLLLLFRQPHSGCSREISAQTPGLDDYITGETGQKDRASCRVSGRTWQQYEDEWHARATGLPVPDTFKPRGRKGKFRRSLPTNTSVSLRE